MEDKKKACWNCGNFGRYYKRGFCQFYKTELGSCSVKGETVDKRGFCDKWRNRCSLRTERRKMSLKVLDEICRNIEEIKQLLEEENEECKMDPYCREI